MNRAGLALLLLFIAAQVFAEETREPDGDKPVPEAEIWSSDHELRIGGKTVRYEATAGTMMMRDDEDQPVALFGYTAYVVPGGDMRVRPILFAYNGGPGSASIWLHMGVLGPQRAVATDAGFSPNGPYRRVENEYSIVDEADLVMIDPVGTGFIRNSGRTRP